MTTTVNRILSLALALVAASAIARGGDILVRDGQSVAFLGDSITAAGWDSPTGYVKLIASGLQTNGVKIVPIPAGVSGNKSNDMLNRLDADVLKKKPDWLTVSCGVNDVWHGASGIPLEQYKQNMTQLVDRAQAAGVKVMILTATMIGEDAPNENNTKLAGYNEFLRQLAAEKHCPLADLNSDMQAAVKELVAAGYRPGHLLTQDGVHMNPRGNVMMATGVLRAFGLDDAQIAKAREAWLDMPHGWSGNVTYSFTATKELTLREYLKLAQQTPKDNPGVLELLQSMFNDDVRAVLAPAGDKDAAEKLKQSVREKFDRSVDEAIKK
jgi:lysophospholipase L1-like esterase